MKRNRLVPPWKPRGKLLRSVLYSAALVGLLLYVSYRFVFANPSQVRLRILRGLEDIVAGRVELGSIVHGWNEGTRVEEISLSPAASGEEPIVRFEGVRMEPPRRSSLSRPGRVLRSVFKHSVEPEFHVRVDRAEVSLRHERDGSSNAWSRGWNWTDVVDVDALSRYLEEQPFELRVDKAEIAVTEVHPEVRGVSWRTTVRDVRLLNQTRGILVEADLERATAWRHGYVEAYLGRSRELDVHLTLDNSRRGVEDLLVFLPSSSAARWRRIRPRGTADVEATLRWRGEDVSWFVDVEHFDGSLSLPGAGLEASHVLGKMRLESQGFSWGEEAGTQPSGCEVWGVDCLLSGSWGGPGRKLILRLPRTELGSLKSSECPEFLIPVLAWSFTAGEVKGEVAMAEDSEGSDWSSSFSIEQASFARLPGVTIERGELTARGSGGGGQGELTIARLTWEQHLGTVKGTVDVAWDSDSLELQVNLTVEAPPVLGLELSPGTLTGGWRLCGPDGEDKAQFRWESLALVCPLLAVETLDGSFDTTLKKSAEETAGTENAAESGGRSIRGKCTLVDVRIPGNVLGESSLGFDTGECRWRIDGRSLIISPLQLVTDDQVLRAYGQIRLTGEIDLVCVLAEGNRADALKSVNLDAPARLWREAIGHGEAFVAWRLTGTVSSPSTERIEAAEFDWRYVEE